MRGWKPDIYKLENEPLLLKNDLAKAMKISVLTLTQWLKILSDPALTVEYGHEILYRRDNKIRA